jgi:hypothetical protein
MNAIAHLWHECSTIHGNCQGKKEKNENFLKKAIDNDSCLV